MGIDKDIIKDIRRVLEDVIYAQFNGMGYYPGYGQRNQQSFVDMVETQEEIIITAELPGVKNEDIRITATKNEIEIRLESGNNQGTFQGRYSNFYSSSKTPAPIQPEKIKSAYKNGILEIKAKKLKTNKWRIKIN